MQCGDNQDPFLPDWTPGESFINYSFDNDDLNGIIINPNDDNELIKGWGTLYQRVDFDSRELLKVDDGKNYIYMVPKEADALEGNESKNINITVSYHVIGHTGPGGDVVVTEEITVTSYQRVRY